MRTTLTLDEDMDRSLRVLARSRGLSFKEAVNQALRQGLLALERPPQRTRSRVKPKALGVLPGIDYDAVGQLAEE